jgi:glycosyltransferase involved in cell wall biosynthesis
MKLAVLCDAIYPYHHGGKETLHYERSARLARRGHEVRIHTMHWWPERESQIVRDGVALHAIAPRVPMYSPKGRRSIWESLAFGLGALRVLWSPPFDVLDVDQFPFTPFFAARLARRVRRRPVTATWYEVWDRAYWREYMGWLGPVGFFLQRFAARSADLIFADSRLTARRLTDWLGVDPRRVIVVAPAGTEGISPSPLRSKTVDCIFIGRLLPHKHVDVLLEMLARLPDVTALIVGTGPEKERLIAQARRLSLSDRIRFESGLSRETILERLRGARLLTFPSTREGFGVVVLEANACGVPALVVQHPDNAALELVRDGVNGMIADLDPGDLAAKTAAYLADPAAQARMSAAATTAAAGYSWEAYVSRTEAALEELTSTRLETAA